MGRDELDNKIDDKYRAGHGSFSAGQERLDPNSAQSGLQSAENSSNPQANTAPSDATDLNNRESEAGPAGNWNDNVSPSKTGAGLGSKKGLANTIKGLTGRKKSAIGAMLALIVGGGIGFSALFSPGMLIVHLKEIASEKLDTSSLSMNARSNKLLAAKIDDSTSGYCGRVATIKCRFSTLSEKNLKNLRAAGIDIEGGTTVAGRYKPTAYKFTDPSGRVTTLTAKEFASFSRSNPQFRAALKQAYNPRFSQFTGKAWSFVSGKLGINKAKTKIFSGTNTENMEDMNSRAKEKLPGDTQRTRAPLDSTEGCDGTDCTARNGQIDAELGNKTAEIDADKMNGNKAVKNALSAVEPGKIAASAAGNAFKVTSVADNACMAYGAVRAVGYAAKTVRALQLAAYAMVFLKVADEIKAGTADAETVAYLGGLLTAVSVDVTSTTRRISGSATDSFGYKNLAFGDITSDSKSMTTMGQYMAGGGFTGELIQFTETVTNELGGTEQARSTCKTLANPWVQAGSLVGGIALMLIPGTQGISAARIAVGAGVQVVMSAGLALLPSLLQDIVAGTTTDDLMGSPVGDALVSGVRVIESSMQQAGGNPPATVDQVVNFAPFQEQQLALQAEEDRATLSPFDTSSKYTFLGSMVNSFMPIYASAASGPSKLMATLSMPLAGAAQKASAKSAEQLRKEYTMCDDVDYKYMKIAADIFCNPVYLMPQQYLAIDPMENIDKLLAANELSDEGEPIGEFADFVATCILREEALGFEGTDGNGKDGSECKIEGGNADIRASRYIYWMDYEAETGMSDEQELVGSASEETSNGGGTPATGISENSGNITADGWAYPLDPGSSMRGDYGRHIGNDMPKPIGSKIYAIRDGTVTRTEVVPISVVQSYCSKLAISPKIRVVAPQQNILIESVIDGVTYIARYAHVNDFNVRPGQQVKAGDLIGHTGLNGCTTGPHLHVDLSTSLNSGVQCQLVSSGRCYIMIRSIFGSSW